jgi:hypothetical protein
MKRTTSKFFISMAAVMGLALSASADLVYTFDSDASGGTQGGTFNGGSYAWSSVFGGAIQQTSTTGGWTLGGTGPKFEFNWPAQSVMQNRLNTYGNLGVRISFDLMVSSDWTFNYGPWAEGDWYQLHWAGNSDGASGWTQDVVNGVTLANPVSTNYHMSDPDLTWHFDLAARDLGFAQGDTWFQIFFGSNSGSDNAVQFFIDNIHVYVPEPSTFTLAAIFGALFCFFQRRK